MRALYLLLIELVTWLILVPVTLFRPGLRERLGHIAPAVRDSRPRLLIHAVSAGEMNAASALAREMATRGWAIVLSAGNDDAMRIAARIPNAERVLRFPWDRRRAMRRWLDAIAPDAVAVIETELWPNLFFACAARGIPLVIANARIDARAAALYRLARRFFARVLECASLVIAVDDNAAARFTALGATRVVVGGDLKADLLAHAPDATPRSSPTILAASTHHGEEAIIVDAVRDLGATLTIAPRHPRRAAAIRRIAPNATVADRMGQLSSLYADAGIVIIGGTFVSVGGHDLLEPAAHGCAIVAGPHIDNIHALAQSMRNAGALRITTDLADTLHELLDDDGARAALGENARRFAESRRGAAALTADRIDQLARGRSRPAQ